MMRMVVGVAVMIAACCATGCTGGSIPPPPPAQSASASPTPTALPPGTTSLDCTNPIGILPAPTPPWSSTLDAVALDTASTLQATSTDGTDPHRLFAKTGLLVHAGRESTLTVPSPWAARVAIAWGNHGAEWTTRLHIPDCPHPPSGVGTWLAFPGGFSLDAPACLPLEVRAASRTTTIHVSAGAPCRD
jgi:hypothetical protein